MDIDSLKTASKKVVHKAGEFIKNKIADAVTKSNDDKIVKQEPVEEIIIRPEERDEILNKLRQVLLWRWNTIKLSKLLNDSTVSKNCDKKMDQSEWFMKLSIFCLKKYKV